MMPKLRLYCLPYSGASAMVYSRWRRKLPGWLEIHPVEMPGRGGRLSESLQTDLPALAEQLADEIAADLPQPYALFGHSLGALMAFEVAHRLQQRHLPRPVALFASGTSGPTRRDDEDLRALKSDEDFIGKLRELQGTPEEVLNNAELMAFTLPILKADFSLCESYEYQDRGLLPYPIHVLGGKQDKTTSEQLLAWKDETSSGFSLDMIEGSHFFIHEHESRVLGIIKNNLEVHLRRYSLQHYAGRVETVAG